MKAMGIAGAVLCLLATSAVAQQAVEPTFYKLDFIVKEVEAGKTVNTRFYSSMLATGKDRGSVRTGNRVPVSTGQGFNYHDVGVSLDFSDLREMPADRVALNLNIDISSNVSSETPGLPPIVRSNKWQGYVVLPLRKATTVFTSDDPSSKRQMQIEITATPIK